MKKIFGILLGYLSVIFLALILIQDRIRTYPWTFLIQPDGFLNSIRLVIEFYPPFLAFSVMEFFNHNSFELELIIPYLVGGLLSGLFTEDGRSGLFVGFCIGAISFIISLPLNTLDLSTAYSIPVWDAFFLSFPFILFGSTLGGLFSLSMGFLGGLLGRVINEVRKSQIMSEDLRREGPIPSPVLFDEEAPIICPYCGSVLPSDAKYCTNCGKKIR
ncbi:MAG: zinc ribbon domain-containing protein [Candidatus Asgardarchaeia archaeon]